ncbi:4Fe-4S binding protein [Neptuniibacter sp. 1_MG-2023]|uniref:4Fe-4S binding protein n=1 Tax=Neptuniibacter sp. 1_MG-2023 TaxID=3062662 RepID=UPI0026E17201|nr:4Fe-4S binding protein [Neptuniibacter sp. 1_MG-2023]MDO6592226.1 4Fe-4S binding protein [Neptuniibacter sp. 1_MG-2023]
MNFLCDVLFKVSRFILICSSLLVSSYIYAVEMPLTSELQQLFPNASHIEQEDKDLSIIPVYRFADIVGYAFQTAEIFPVRGYGGKPIDIMIGLSPEGRYMGFVVIDHYEPIFMKGDGPQRLVNYMQQLIDVPASNNIYIRGDNQKNLTGSGKSTYIDGITSATVTTNAINKTITKAARAVAQAKELAGYASQSHYIPKMDHFEKLNLSQLVERGLVKHWPIYKQQINAAISDKQLGYPSQPVSVDNQLPIAELYAAYFSHPLVAKNLLSDSRYQDWLKYKTEGDQYFLLFSKGLWKQQPFSNFLGLKQRNTEVIRKKVTDFNIGLPGSDWDEITLYRVPPVATFDPLARTKMIFKTNPGINLYDDFQLPAEDFTAELNKEANELELWQELWQQRQNEIALLLLSLVILSILFLNQHFAVLNPKIFHKIRLGFLAFTIIFIGYYAQGQLSIVNILTVQHLWIEGISLTSFLLDPIVSILWCYVLFSLILFGRGLFCGWLCPFGAIQEFAGLLAKKLKIKRWKIKPKWHNQLQKLKYVLLIGIIGASFYSLALGETLAELEPFKTSVTLYFIREWQYVIYAIILILLAMKVHKFYCRYLCPLGASLAILGAFPIFNWLTRRAECGSPCQNCRNNCEIDAIDKQGKIDMKECVQCLECIVINYNPTLCAIEVADTKRKSKQSKQASNIIASTVDV